MSAKPRPRVLAVGSDQAFELAKDALGSAVRLVRASSKDAAWTGGADLALADVRFERSRMVRLFRALKDSPGARRRARGAAAFVNVRRLTRDYGEAVAGEILRQVVIGRLHASHDRAASRRSRLQEVGDRGDYAQDAGRSSIGEF